MLQYASPLVHAHTGGSGSEIGLHLYEFESLPAVADQLTLTDVKQALNNESCIFYVGSAIKPKLDERPGSYSINNCPQNPPAAYVVKNIDFSPLSFASTLTKPVLCSHTCRAPPY
ncbi:MAG: hypothetical protein ABSB19_02820 [Methylomonas sp.]